MKAFLLGKRVEPFDCLCFKLSRLDEGYFSVKFNLFLRIPAEDNCYRAALEAEHLV